MESLNRKFAKIILAATISSAVILLIVYFYFYNIMFQQEVAKERLLAKSLFFTREYLAKQAPHVKIIHTKNPFLCTPAYAVNQISKSIRKRLHFYVKQVSDRYRNPMDKPTSYERDILNILKNPNKKEYYGVENINGTKYLVYAYPLRIEKPCLMCHGVPYKDVPAPIYKKIVKIYGNKAFNYKLGELRGIISVKENYSVIIAKIVKILLIVVVMLFFAFLLGVYLFYKFNRAINMELNKFINHFRKISKKGYSVLKEKMDFKEFENLKSEFNSLVKNIKKSKKELYDEIYYDRLTKLPNRKKLEFVLKKKTNIPLVVIDVDKFKEINAMFGIKTADLLIKEISEKLNNIKTIYSFKIFHIDIDQFVLIFNEQNEEYIKKVVKAVLSILETPYEIEGNSIVIKLKAGISMKGDLIRAVTALDAADITKKDIVFAKEVYNLKMNYEENLKWFKELKNALKHDRIVPFYQPIMDKEGNIIKYEALVRLVDSENRVVSPYFFLDVAKRARLYPEITKTVIEKAFEKFKNSRYGVSVNLGLEDFENGEIKAFLQRKLNEFPEPERITFEILENEEIRENEQVEMFIRNLKNYNVQIFIDDFGSGYANFDYLFKLNADGVKIDGSLVKNISADKKSETIIKIILNFAKETGMKTVAEYVENREIFEKLKELGVDYFQGYYFSPPKPDIEGDV